MKIPQPILYILISTIVIACKKSDKPPIVPSTSGYTVYIVVNIDFKFVYWKDGVEVDPAKNARLRCIAINGEEIYAVGNTNIIPTTGLLTGRMDS